jgi:hypothetical protein
VPAVAFEQHAGAFTLQAVVRDLVVADHVLIDAGRRRLPLTARVERKRVVAWRRDAAIELVLGDDVVLDHVVVRGPELVGQQHATGVPADEVVADLRVGDTHQVDPLTTVARDLFELDALRIRRARGRRDPTGVVANDAVGLDHDMANRVS